MLGDADSGRDSIIKEIEASNSHTYITSELNYYRGVVFATVFKATREILIYMMESGPDYCSGIDPNHIEIIRQRGIINKEAADAVTSIWKGGVMLPLFFKSIDEMLQIIARAF